MVINNLNQLYKPDRLLFYVDATLEDITSFSHGVIPDSIQKYADSFGVYDYLGVFFVKGHDNPVIGIEFRADDGKVNYPRDLEQIKLNGSYFFSLETDDEIGLDRDVITGIFKDIANDGAAHRVYSDLSLKTESDVISVFNYSNKLRILYECAPEGEIARDIISNDADRFDKNVLYNMAFTEPITEHYNWNHQY